MTRIDWSSYSADTTNISLLNNKITEINWEGCPLNIEVFNRYQKQYNEYVAKKRKMK